MRALFFTFVLFATNLVAAPTFTISPTTVRNDLYDTIVYNVSGVTPGARVHFERYLDMNGNGVIDAGEPMVRRFGVNDGVRSLIGGVEVPTIPGDSDGAQNGSIRIELPYPGPEPLVGRMPGRFLVKLLEADPANAVQSFVVAQPDLPQGIAGIVRDASNNNPIPLAPIVLLTGGEGRAILATFSDANGAYSLATAPGAYMLVASKDGNYVSSGPAGSVNVTAGQVANKDILLTPATARVTGRLTESGQSFPIRSVLVVLEQESENGFTVSFDLTDFTGNYRLGALPGEFELSADESSLQPAGYAFSNSAHGTAASSPITQDLSAMRGTALIYGTVRSSQGSLIPGLPLLAGTNNGDDESESRSDGNGNYYIVVPAGAYQVGADSEDLSPLGLRPQWQSAQVAAGQALRLDFVFNASTATVRGRVVDNTGAVVQGVNFHGHHNNSGDQSAGANTGADGRFEFGVWGGEWRFHLGDDAAEQGLLGAELHRTIQDGQNIDLGDYVVIRANRQITGTVRNSTGASLSFVGVSAHTHIGDNEYRLNTETDANGAYSLPVIDGSWSVSLSCFDLEERQLACPSGQSVAVNGANATANFVAAPLVVDAFIRGRATDQSGAPISGLQIGAFNNGPMRVATTDQNGLFEIGVTAGFWSLQISGPAPAGKIGPSYFFEVQRGADINNVEFRLLNSTQTITGTVQSESGAPQGNLFVFASASINNINYSSRGITDDLGRYSIPVANGSWSMNMDCSSVQQRGFECPGIDAAVVQNENVTRDIVLTAPDAWLRGRVVNQDGASVPFIGLETGIFPNYDFTSAEDDGTFVTGVDAGPVELRLARHVPNYIGALLNFNIQQGVDVNNIVFRVLIAQRQIVGTLRNARGGPLPFVRVTATTTIEGQAYSSSETFTLADGSFALPGRFGTWRIQFDCSDLAQRGYVCPEPTYTLTADSPQINVVASDLAAANITNPAFVSATQSLRFRINGAPGTYDVLHSPTLQPGSWQNNGVSATINAGETFTEVTIPTSGGRDFYLVQRRN